MYLVGRWLKNDFSKNLSEKRYGIYPKLINNSHKFVKLTNRNAVYALEFSPKGIILIVKMIC